MRILIDTSPLQNQNANRGIGTYTGELVRALRNLHTEHEFFTSSENPQRVDLIHYPFFDLFFTTLPMIKKSKTVVTIHDVTPLVFAKQYPRGIKGEFKFFWQKLALSSVNHIITDSKCSKKDIINYLKIGGEKISVVPLAASDDFAKVPQSAVDLVRKHYQIPKNYVLYVGDINYNKNLPFLISVMSKIPNMTLVLVGKQMQNFTLPEGRAIAEAIRTNGSDKKVRLISNVMTKEDLVAIYSGASLYVQPSLYEGFGLPVIEAMRCKVPVVSSSGGSLAEVVGEYGEQFYPTEPLQALNLIRQSLRISEGERARRVRHAYEYSLGFTWERTAKETLKVYEDVMRV